MYGTLVLLMIFLIWQAVDRRRNDEPLWLRMRRRKQEKTHWDSVPPTEYVRRDFVMPPIRERIESCYETQEQYLRELQACTEQEDLDELVTLLYTPGRMYRAAIFREARKYQVVHETLLLYDEEDVYWNHADGAPFGEWAWDRGEHWYDDLESAEEAARSVLHRLESAEREALTGADLPG